MNKVRLPETFLAKLKAASINPAFLLRKSAFDYDVIGSRRARDLRLVLCRHAGDHPPAKQLDYLCQHQPDAACRRVHERHITRLNGVELGREMVGRHALHHEARRNLVIDRVGNRHKRVGAYRDLLSIAAWRVHPCHALADAQRLDAFGKGDHRARTLDTRNKWGCQVTPQLPRPHANVHEIDAGRAHLNERLARAGSGRETDCGGVGAARAAVSFYSDRLHVFLFMGIAGWSSIWEIKAALCEKGVQPCTSPSRQMGVSSPVSMSAVKRYNSPIAAERWPNPDYQLRPKGNARL
jgi:hypothetical protein